MTREEAIKIINSAMTSYGEDAINYDKVFEARDIAIRSLEAWEKVEKEIDDSILICRESAQNNIWCDGELAGFLQSKDIINENLSEVSE